MSERSFTVGSEVDKVTGDYRVRGVVVSRFRMLSGAERYVVEIQAQGGGSFCHIYGPHNLRSSASEVE